VIGFSPLLHITCRCNGAIDRSIDDFGTRQTLVLNTFGDNSEELSRSQGTFFLCLTVRKNGVFR
jgi:hypothetical protein